MEELKITETYIVEKIKEFLINKERGNWHEDKAVISNLLKKYLSLSKKEKNVL